MAEDMEPGLKEKLTSPDEAFRVEGLEEVIGARDAACLPYVVACLYHASPEVRRKAATALRSIKDPKVADIALLALVTEDDADVIFDLIMVFLYRPREEAVDELLAFLDYGDFRIRSAAVDVLGALGGVFGRQDVVKPLLPLLQDVRPSVVMVTLRALVHIAESLADREILAEIASAAAGLEGSSDRMVSELARTVRRQVGDSLSMLGGEAT